MKLDNSLIIMTGVSRGIGSGILNKLLENNAMVIGCSRGSAKLNQTYKNYFHISQDLSENQAAENLIERAKEIWQAKSFEQLFLINNAGVLPPIKPIGRYLNSELDFHLRVNLFSPLYLMNLMVSWAQNLAVEKMILNISSGAGKNPYEGWSAYCTGKAGLDMYSRVLAEEQVSQKLPFKVFSVAPGVVETHMQETIRQTNKADFNQLQKFINLKENDQLLSVDVVAEKFYQLLTAKIKPNQVLFNINDHY